MLKRLLAGAVLGLAWGIGLRAWMRFISTDPEFTWAGTLFIVGATTIAGLATGLAYHRYRLNRGWAWRFLALTYLPLGTAAGAVMLPSFVLGGIAWGRRTWSRWVRIPLALAAVGVQVAFVLDGFDDIRRGRTIPALLLYAGFLVLETKAFSLFFRPRPARTDDPRLSQSDDHAVGTPPPLPGGVPG